MMKLLIVDDEQVEREGLKYILEKNFSGLVIEQAKNGQAAIQIVEEFSPDLVLMDIQMPGINGLEAIERINKDHPNIKFIMITAFAKFDYAHTAMKLGVKDYLLKPSKTSEIIDTVGKVLSLLEQERESMAISTFQQHALQKTLPIVETDVVTQLLFDHMHDIHLDELIQLLDIQMSNEKFVMSVLLPKGAERFYSAIKEKVRKTERGWVGALYGRQLPIIVFRQQEKSFRLQAVSLAQAILSIPKSTNNSSWFIGIGNVCHSLDKIRHSYQESLIATKEAKPHVRFRFYADLPTHDENSEDQNLKQLEKKLFDQVRNGKWEEFSSYVINLIHRYESEKTNVMQSQQRVLELLWIASRVLTELGVEPYTPLFSTQIHDFRQLQAETSYLLDYMWQSYVDYCSQLEDDTIQQIKQYIIEHSHKEISLDKIAHKVGLSPIYISKMFKEQLGVNYISFLTECRIEKAKKLMMNPDKSLKEITFEVGYHDPNYFSKVFKKLCGASPTEYRKSLIGMKE
ncbi:response regulator [Cytobacillus sp. IB215316]|uniref:response regulator n=1 Tax=Cytobacillus sp. IB215316 TaxID=3097354 RepID=UPI002A12D133|nr:response regulator [Cytobacillus sp. IB215316]MDX8360959.1 response regulator [Cytobacillus sp. IB215316]